MSQLPANLSARLAKRQGNRGIAAAVVTGLGSASPPYVSLKGGVFTLIDANGEQEPVDERHLDCVIFDVNAEVPIQRVFWGKDKTFDPNADAFTPPVCFSDNGIGASRNAQDPQSTSCQQCQWNTWGSATSKVTGKGVKACQAIKKVAVVVPGWDFPFLLRVPVMSHENLRVYGDKFKGQEFDVSDVVTRITFVHGAVGQIDFTATGFTDDDTEALVQKILDSKATDALIGRGDVAIQQLLPPPANSAGVAAAAAALPAQPQPAPPPPPVAAPVLPAEPPKTRGRKKVAQTQDPFAVPQPADQGIPPFFKREQSTGIQGNAPPPPAELEAQLNDIFKMPT